MRTPRSVSTKRQLRDWQQNQRAAAEAICEHPDHYGGDEAALVRWARALLTNAEHEQRARLPLFDGPEAA